MATNTDLLIEFIECNPNATRRMMGEATGLSKDQLRTTLSKIRGMVLLETQIINGRTVEFYTANPHYDKQRVVIKQFEPIAFTHHPVMQHLYGMVA